jgi:hypothetical protein
LRKKKIWNCRNKIILIKKKKFEIAGIILYILSKKKFGTAGRFYSLEKKTINKKKNKINK